LASGILGRAVGKFHHLAIQVLNFTASHVYVSVLGLEVEFEHFGAGFGALKDEADFALFLGQVPGKPASTGAGHWRQVAEVEVFDHPPQKTLWGYAPSFPIPTATSSMSGATSR
jgi:hypothetical protein